MSSALSETQRRSFADDVSAHVMTVLRDDGVYRHLRFGRPGSSMMSFDIITWPGRLAYTGDMGCYVFERLPDMFQFFRGGLSLDYWAEKVVAVDRHDLLVQFSEAAFTAWVMEALNDLDVEDDERDELRRRVVAEVLSLGDEYSMREALDAFLDDYGENVFTDTFECRGMALCGRFLWCCQALSWAIDRYDRWKDEHGHGQT